MQSQSKITAIITSDCISISINQLLTNCHVLETANLPIYISSIVLFTVSGGWSGWSAWVGTHGGCERRTRTCTHPRPSCGGANCSSGSSVTRCDEFLASQHASPTRPACNHPNNSLKICCNVPSCRPLVKSGVTPNTLFSLP
mgnify:CR=1 FL=1